MGSISLLPIGGWLQMQKWISCQDATSHIKPVHYAGSVTNASLRGDKFCWTHLLVPFVAYFCSIACLWLWRKIADIKIWNSILSRKPSPTEGKGGLEEMICKQAFRMYLSRYDFVVLCFFWTWSYRLGKCYLLFPLMMLWGLRQCGKKRWGRLISAHRALEHSAFAFLPPSLWEGLVCLS